MLSRQIREAGSIEEAQALALEIDLEVSNLIERHKRRITALTQIETRQ